MPVDTATITRRAVRFTSPAEALSDAHALVRAEHEGRLKRLGNWSLGQALNHVASWIDYGFDGYPFTVSTEDQAASRARKDLALSRGLRQGVHIKGGRGPCDRNRLSGLEFAHRTGALFQ